MYWAMSLEKTLLPSVDCVASFQPWPSALSASQGQHKKTARRTLAKSMS